MAVAAAVLGAGVGCGNDDADANRKVKDTRVGSATVVEIILTNNCMPCHVGVDAKEGLHLDTIAGLLAGSEDGPMVVPGDAAASHIIKNLRGLDGEEPMPYGLDPLSERDIQLIEEWINAGAATS
ncbi:MAG: hypothetical protein IH945_06710 [Armatimonadetes bacterium]|nr:hypothetical protein [Armatimonadota bacterium]